MLVLAEDDQDDVLPGLDGRTLEVFVVEAADEETPEVDDTGADAAPLTRQSLVKMDSAALYL